MTKYFLGIDIGGTKSHALLADEQGRVRGFAQSGPGNYEVVGWDGLRATLQAITQRALDSSGLHKRQIAAMGLGVAGYDWPGERGPTEAAIESLDTAAPYSLVNDAEIALVAGAPQGWGVVIIAGTSNNCRGRDRRGRTGRVTGCGPIYGEYGGASEMVAEAVRSIARAWTHRGPATGLGSAFSARAGASDVEDLLEGLYLGRYHITSEAVHAVFHEAERGDMVALQIIAWAGQELGDLANGVIHQLGFEEQAFDCVLAGSLFRGSPKLAQALCHKVRDVAPLARFVRLDAPPVVGGVLLAMEIAGMETEAVRPTLLAELGALNTAADSTGTMPEPVYGN
jgi:N-acetylglucosamine kinase-like BadF-type ATPase